MAGVLGGLSLFVGLGCSSAVQDLGRDSLGEPSAAVPSEAAPEGLGAGWSDSRFGRDLACPLTRPIEGDECPTRNTAPCTYHGEPEHGPDRPPLASEGNRTTTLCACALGGRWRCVQGVTIRTLLQPYAEGDACVDSLTLVGPAGGECRCAGGRLRCTP